MGRRPLDRTGLHALLYSRAINGRIRLDISALSEELRCSRKTLHVALNDLKDAGLVKKITKTARTPVGLWEVIDPDVAKWMKKAPTQK